MTRNHWFVLELVIDTLSVTMCSAQRIHLSNRTSFPSLNCSKLKLKSIITHSLLCYDRSYGMQAVITMLKYSSFILSAINDILTIWDLRSTRYHAITIFSNLKNDVLEGGKGFFLFRLRVSSILAIWLVKCSVSVWVHWTTFTLQWPTWALTWLLTALLSLLIAIYSALYTPATCRCLRREIWI